MLIEVLYVPGCPNHQPAVGRLKDVLRSESLDIPINEIAVEDEAAAKSLQFPGSPTIRIDGLDAEPTVSQMFGIAYRIYSGADGLPSEEALHRAISAARMREGNRLVGRCRTRIDKSL